MKKLLHKIPFVHFWTNWETVYDGEFGLTYWRTVQRRECKICGKKQIKKRTF